MAAKKTASADAPALKKQDKKKKKKVIRRHRGVDRRASDLVRKIENRVVILTRELKEKTPGTRDSFLQRYYSRLTKQDKQRVGAFAKALATAKR